MTAFSTFLNTIKKDRTFTKSLNRKSNAQSKTINFEQIIKKEKLIMEKIMYRWYYKEEGKATISGVVLAETWNDAVEKTKEYLRHQFDDINGEMNFMTSEDSACLQNDERFVTTLWVWEADTDDDYNDDFPDCLAVAY